MYRRYSVGNICYAAAFRVKAAKYLRREKIPANAKSDGRVLSHVTYAAVGNAGDTVLSQCVRRLFEKECRVKEWLIEAVDAGVSEAYLSRLNSTSGVVVGGGGLFVPDTNGNSISGWQWAISKEQLACISSPIVLFAVGYNYFRGQAPSKLFLENLPSIIGKAEFVGLRNTGSVENVKALLPDELARKVVFQPCATTLIRKIYESIPNKAATRNVGFNVAFDRMDKRYGDKKELVLTEIAKAAKTLQEKGYSIRFIAHCPDDLDFLPYLAKQHVEYTAVDLSRSFPDEVFKTYNSIEVMIGMRGHAQMIPFGMNCGIITLGSHEKMRWFLEDIEMMDCYVELGEHCESISERILEVFVERYEIDCERTTARLIEAQNRLLAVTLRNMRAINGILG